MTNKVETRAIKNRTSLWVRSVYNVRWKSSIFPFQISRNIMYFPHTISSPFIVPKEKKKKTSENLWKWPKIPLRAPFRSKLMFKNTIGCYEERKRGLRQIWSTSTGSCWLIRKAADDIKLIRFTETFKFTQTTGNIKGCPSLCPFIFAFL